jgi:predicted amidohydrolase
MKVAVVQFEPALHDKINNFNRIKDYIKEIHADIIVFPELALSGYFFLSRDEVSKIAEPFTGSLIMELQDLSSSLHKILVIGFPEVAQLNLYNSAAILIPDKEKSRVYRKTHLFYKERFCFDYGNSGFFVIDYPEWDIKIGTMICYDWRFPEAARTLALQGADLLVCPSNLVTNAWKNAFATRALENNVYIAVSNRIGKEKRGDEELVFNGESTIYNYYGGVMCRAGKEGTRIMIAEILPSKAREKSFNQFNDIFSDRMPEMYKL